MQEPWSTFTGSHIVWVFACTGTLIWSFPYVGWYKNELKKRVHKSCKTSGLILPRNFFSSSSQNMVHIQGLYCHIHLFVTTHPESVMTHPGSVFQEIHIPDVSLQTHNRSPDETIQTPRCALNYGQKCCRSKYFIIMQIFDKIKPKSAVSGCIWLYVVRSFEILKSDLHCEDAINLETSQL